MKEFYNLHLESRTPRPSTGRLTDEDIDRQELQYKKSSHYDYVVIGSGIAGLTVGSLLAHRGASVCVLEAHDVPGGYGHTFKWGDFHFNAQLHYICGCGDGEVVRMFLKRIDLEREVTFENYEPSGYDQIRLPDGRVVRIPNGFDNFHSNLQKLFPEESAKIKLFLAIVDRFHDEMRHSPIRSDFWTLRALASAFQIPTMFRFQNKTLEDLFNVCRLSPEVRAVFSAICGSFLAPPRELSAIGYGGLLGSFNTGAYYPTKHFRHFVHSIVNAITRRDSCALFLETPVTNIDIERNRVRGVTTGDGKTFTADNYICNMDPQAAIALAGAEHFPWSIKRKASYEYSHGSMMIYLGLRGVDLREYGYGNYNRWHLEQWNMNQCWDEIMEGNYARPWMFMATPSLHSREGGIAPPGCQILEILSLANYDLFAEAKRRGKTHYDDLKAKVGDRLLDLVEEHYVPGLRRHVVKYAYGTPTTNEDFVLAPRGNAYGSHITPRNLGLDRMRADTGLRNLFWCNAASGFHGVLGTVRAGVILYMNLTGDWFWDPKATPADDVLIRALRQEQLS